MIDKNYFQGKSIIIAIPDDFGLPKMFKNNLEFLGFKVLLLEHSKDHNKIAFKEEVKHIYHKIFKRDRSYKPFAKEQKRRKTEKILQLSQLQKFEEKTDFALIIRPDLLNDEVILEVKNKTKKLIGYQWDGLERYPEVLVKTKFFDQFFVFDTKDLALDSNFKLTTNFYFDFDLNTPENPSKDVFFIGSHIENRMPLLIKISQYLAENNFKTDINVIGSSKKYIHRVGETGIRHITEIFDFSKNYEHIKDSKVILDLLNNVHNGLSFRTFEALGFQKKLITDNKEVLNYDFYHKNNIFVVGKDNLDSLQEFMALPYQVLSKEIYLQYSFSKWINTILE